eukprot:GHVU01022200.1.p2 GENE.GHVU01022200.1~~GHVU01022200.1.p2  ORF type:complete len:254 (-),score=41.26 GHVU01022200.1:358-1119(-)
MADSSSSCRGRPTSAAATGKTPQRGTTEGRTTDIGICFELLEKAGEVVELFDMFLAFCDMCHQEGLIETPLPAPGTPCTACGYTELLPGSLRPKGAPGHNNHHQEGFGLPRNRSTATGRHPGSIGKRDGHNPSTSASSPSNVGRPGASKPGGVKGARGKGGGGVSETTVVERLYLRFCMCVDTLVKMEVVSRPYAASGRRRQSDISFDISDAHPLVGYARDTLEDLLVARTPRVRLAYGNPHAVTTKKATRAS